MFKITLFYTLLSISSLIAAGSDQRLTMLYNSLDPTSVAQHLAFYELYGKQPIGNQALRDALQLLSGQQPFKVHLMNEISLSESLINGLVSLINKSSDQELQVMNESQLREIEKLAARLSHTKLKGHTVQSESELLQLPLEEIDLARGLFLSQLGNDIYRIRSYEAMIDLMALQVLARLPERATPEQKIEKINALIFDEMEFRFPPHSLHAKEIDVYTFLPSVLDSHRGVCLGVSILYMCIAQRLDLQLEMITPPGHIYVRYKTLQKTINIETTARGIHVDSEEYLSVNTRQLQQRNIKEVIGLAHFNQASVFWQQADYEKAYSSYQHAKNYMGEDPLLNELLGYICLFTDRKEEGEKLINKIKNHIPDYAIKGNTAAEDYLNGHVDAEGIKVVYSHTEDNRQSIFAKKEALEQVVKKYPYFRTGLLHLAMSWIQLYRIGEALQALEEHHKIDPNDPEANAYLAILYAQRFNYQKSWEHLRVAEALVEAKGYKPKTLKELRRSLIEICPE